VATWCILPGEGSLTGAAAMVLAYGALAYGFTIWGSVPAPAQAFLFHNQPQMSQSSTSSAVSSGIATNVSSLNTSRKIAIRCG
jgi:hypothetical protein